MYICTHTVHTTQRTWESSCIEVLLTKCVSAAGIVNLAQANIFTECIGLLLIPVTITPHAWLYITCLTCMHVYHNIICTCVRFHCHMLSQSHSYYHYHALALAEIMKVFLTKYDNLFECSFPYLMGWHGETVLLVMWGVIWGELIDVTSGIWDVWLETLLRSASITWYW